MNLRVKELEGTSTQTHQDGIVIDFRNLNEHCFFIDKSTKIIKPNQKYKITIELVKEDIISKNDIIIKEE